MSIKEMVLFEFSEPSNIYMRKQYVQTRLDTHDNKNRYYVRTDVVINRTALTIMK